MEKDQFEDWKKQNSNFMKAINSTQWKNLPSVNKMFSDSTKRSMQMAFRAQHKASSMFNNPIVKAAINQGAVFSKASTALRYQKGRNAMAELLNSERWRQIHKMAERAKKSVEDFRKKYPDQKVLIDELYDSGWAIGNEIGNFSRTLLHPEEFPEHSQQKMDQYYTDYYVNSDGLIEELEGIEDSLTLHRETIKGLINVLKESPSSWKLLYPQIFAVIDAIMVSQSHDGNLEVAEYSNLRKVRAMHEQSKEDEKVSIDIFKYAYSKTIEMAEDLWQFQSFDVSSEKIEFGRNSIQHGRYDPENYTYKQFVQLVILMTTLCIYNDKRN